MQPASRRGAYPAWRHENLIAAVPFEVPSHVHALRKLKAFLAGKDADKLDEQQRGGLRRQALDWLGAELTQRSKAFAKANAQTKAALEQQLRHWQSDTDLAGVRDSDALAKLPEDERKQWQQLWTEVETLRKKASAGR
jgi:hypothetical protein